MATNEDLKATLEHFREQHQRKLDELKPKLDELKALETTVRQLRIQLGETVEAADVSDIAIASAETASSGLYTPRPDEFFTMSQGDAAKAFLDRTGHAVSLDELVQGLKSGGCKVGGVDPKKTLYISLVRNVREFVPVGNGYIGLRKFYAGTARPGRPSKAVQHQKKKKKKKKVAKRKPAARHEAMAKQAEPKTKAQPTEKATPETKQNPAEIKQAIRKIMSDRTPRTLNELLEALQLSLSRPVKKIAIYGTLRNRDFEQVGEKYRLRQPDQEEPTQTAIVN
jgi:hypothetical protein